MDESTYLDEKDLYELLAHDYQIQSLVAKKDLTSARQRIKFFEVTEQVRKLHDEYNTYAARAAVEVENIDSEIESKRQKYESFKKGLSEQYNLSWDFNEGSFDDETGQLHGPL